MASETLPVTPEIPVLHESAGFLVVAKPAGLLVVPGREETDVPTVIQALSQARGERLFVVHRLDRETSGALVVARDVESHRRLSMAFEAGKVRKTYRALCVGRVAEDAFDIRTALVPARRGRMRTAREGEAGKEAHTHVKVRARWAAASDLAVEPLTGRTHQIRVHLLSVGHPLLVDRQYTRPEPSHGLTRTPLHAWKLSMPADVTGAEPLALECGLPEDMLAAIASLRVPES